MKKKERRRRRILRNHEDPIYIVEHLLCKCDAIDTQTRVWCKNERENDTFTRYFLGSISVYGFFPSFLIIAMKIEKLFAGKVAIFTWRMTTLLYTNDDDNNNNNESLEFLATRYCTYGEEKWPINNYIIFFFYIYTFLTQRVFNRSLGRIWLDTAHFIVNEIVNVIERKVVCAFE